MYSTKFATLFRKSRSKHLSQVIAMRNLKRKKKEKSDPYKSKFEG